MTEPESAEEAVAVALDAEAVKVPVADLPVAAAEEDPWITKSRFMAGLSITGAEESIGNVKRLLGLAEAAAVACEVPVDRAEKLMDVADRWKYLLSL